MKIGVLGPPGVGKTKFARALAKEFNLRTIDGYVQRLQKKTELALGPWSSYAELFMVAGIRQAEESYIHANAKPDTITVGTIMDSFTYATLHSDVVMRKTPEHHQAAYARGQAAMQGMSLLYAQTWDYNVAFHLPYTEEQLGSVEQWQRNLDLVYGTVLDSMMVPYLYTLNGPLDERVTLASEVIAVATKETDEDTTEETATPEADERAV